MKPHANLHMAMKILCVSPKYQLKTSNVFSAIMVGRAGFEPATNGLKIHCSTT